MKLSHKEVEHIALLARLGLRPEEIDKFSNQLSSILEYVKQLQEVDVTGIEPTAQVTGLENVLRPDEILVSDPETTKALLKNAPDVEDNLIKTKSVF
jgi:aspartyl-tRNA(Asn)/glutamyl-tRNA(Gln) amidotransferase subunit C